VKVVDWLTTFDHRARAPATWHDCALRGMVVWL